MGTNNKIYVLKTAFWLGAITDALAALIMIFPNWGGVIFGHDNPMITHAYRYTLSLGAALMVGWTVLLIWGSLKPFERKGLLLITICPVILGIIAAQVYAVSSGYIELKKMVPVWIHLTIISCFFLLAYFNSKNTRE